MLIFDTGSDWMTVESHSCSNCKGENFNYEASETFKFSGAGRSKREYGSAVLEGIEAKDRVCLVQKQSGSHEICLPSFEFFLISR